MKHSPVQKDRHVVSSTEFNGDIQYESLTGHSIDVSVQQGKST